MKLTGTVIRAMSIMTAVISTALSFAGCSGLNSPHSTGEGSQPQQTAFVTGAWSGKAVSNQNNGTSLIFANIQSQGAGSYFSTPQQTMVCEYGNASCMEEFTAIPGDPCEEIPNYSLTETVSGNQVTGSVTASGYCANAVSQTITFAGTLSQDGKSITGTYTTTYTPPSGGVADSGTLQASISGSVTGTYTGQVVSGDNQKTYPVSFALTQNSDGSVAGSGMVSNSLCVSAVTVNNSTSNPSFAVGGAFHVDADLGQSNFMNLTGIPNGDGTYALYYNLSATSSTCGGDVGTGTATKQ